MAFKKSKEPFEKVGFACAIVSGLVSLGYILHLITQQLGDYMIYWTIAFPVVVLLLWFIWNLIKAPHQINKDDLAAANSGFNQYSPRKSVSQKLAGLIFISVIAAAFMFLLALKNYQIEQLKIQKPLPDTIIPSTETQTANPVFNIGDVAGGNNQFRYVSDLHWLAAKDFEREDYNDSYLLGKDAISLCEYICSSVSAYAPGISARGMWLEQEAKKAASSIPKNEKMNIYDLVCASALQIGKTNESVEFQKKATEIFTSGN